MPVRLSHVMAFTLGLLLALAGALSGVTLDHPGTLSFLPGRAAAEEALDHDLIREAYDTIEQQYVIEEAVNPESLTHGAISGMVETLGDTGHSRYLTEGERRAHQQSIQGEFEGIGVEVTMKEGNLTIVSPIDGTPADRAGLQAGEVIQAVNGHSLERMTMDEAIQRILGPAGTEVTLTILDPETNQTREVTLERAEIQLQAVTWAPVPGTTLAQLRISMFNADVTSNVRQALQEIEQANLTGVILDLRNNPGGLLDEAVGTASQFLPEGPVLLVKDTSGEVTELPVDQEAIAPDIPVVVLVNEGTASAAEIVTGAMQDHDRAIAIGVKTFGTGTVLRQFTLSDGSALLLATQLWLTPDGREIWREGLEPNITVDLAPDVSPLYPETVRTLSPEALNESEDAQLLRAIKQLSNEQASSHDRRPPRPAGLSGSCRAEILAASPSRRPAVQSVYPPCQPASLSAEPALP